MAIIAGMNNTAPAIGTLLRYWRKRRKLSQLDLAANADISQRHLSFIESGRAIPSRGMLLRLAEQLRVPVRQRNTLLLAAGFAPIFRERSFDEPDFEQAQQAVRRILDAHAPFPALAIDRHWNLLIANQPAMMLLDGIPKELLTPPVNVLRISLHPHGLSARIRNLREWREHLLMRLARQVEESADDTLRALLEELESYGATSRKPQQVTQGLAGLAVPFELETDAGTLSFLSTTTVFGTAIDINLAELAVESFFPANNNTAEILRQMLSAPQAKTASR